MSTSASAIFTGTSTYSQDLQNVIAREVAIASLPITQLQNNVSQLTAQSGELQTLGSRFSALQAALSNLSAAAGQMLSATSSNPSALQPTLSSGALAGSYSLTVDNLGSFSNALSLDHLGAPVTDPNTQSISASGTYTLTVGAAAPTLIQPAGPGLNALAQAINQAHAGVQATVVNVGGSAAPDYRLSLQSEQLSDVSMQLNDGTQDLLAPTGDPGQPARYTVNGRPVESASRSVTLAPGLTVELTGTTAGAPATLTVAPDNTAAGNALSAFVSAYNAAVDELNHNRGQGGGALAGQSILSTLDNTLHQLTAYTGGGAISSLASLGLTFADTSGHLSFDAETFQAATGNQLDGLAQFLGSPDSGGFLQRATNVLNGIEDADSGSLTLAIQATLNEIGNVNEQIGEQQRRVDLLQANLTQQMAAADALIASMQQQAVYFNGMFTAMQVAANAASAMAGGTTAG
jgi:flagellar hook-associated protein 2